jgi:hypothetical protein
VSVVVGSGVVPGGIIVIRNVLPEHPEAAVVPVIVYVTGAVIAATFTVVVVPIVVER